MGSEDKEESDDKTISDISTETPSPHVGGKPVEYNIINQPQITPQHQSGVLSQPVSPLFSYQNLPNHRSVPTPLNMVNENDALNISENDDNHRDTIVIAAPVFPRMSSKQNALMRRRSSSVPDHHHFNNFNNFSNRSGSIS